MGQDQDLLVQGGKTGGEGHGFAHFPVHDIHPVVGLGEFPHKEWGDAVVVEIIVQKGDCAHEGQMLAVDREGGDVEPGGNVRTQAFRGERVGDEGKVEQVGADVDQARGAGSDAPVKDFLRKGKHQIFEIEII
jgi:hypothetical protein